MAEQMRFRVAQEQIEPARAKQAGGGFTVSGDA